MERARWTPKISRIQTVSESDSQTACRWILSRISGSGVASRSTKSNSMQSLGPSRRANSGISHFEFGRLVLQTLSEHCLRVIHYNSKTGSTPSAGILLQLENGGSVSSQPLSYSSKTGGVVLLRRTEDKSASTAHHSPVTARKRGGVSRSLLPEFHCRDRLLMRLCLTLGSNYSSGLTGPLYFERTLSPSLHCQ